MQNGSRAAHGRSGKFRPAGVEVSSKAQAAAEFVWPFLSFLLLLPLASVPCCSLSPSLLCSASPRPTTSSSSEGLRGIQSSSSSSLPNSTSRFHSPHPANSLDYLRLWGASCRSTFRFHPSLVSAKARKEAVGLVKANERKEGSETLEGRRRSPSRAEAGASRPGHRRRRRGDSRQPLEPSARRRKADTGLPPAPIEAGSPRIRHWQMAAAKPLSRLISHVILDLDGTLLNTDGIVEEVMRVFLVKYGKQWDRRSVQRIVGKTPLEAANAIVEDYSLPCSTEEFMAAVIPLFTERWCNIKALPGANRLVRHLASSQVPLALASNSPRSNIDSKIAHRHGWKESFTVIVGGDEVKSGKPSPEIFLEAAKRMNADPSNCLVIEDSLPGVMAGKAAGMEVVAVPSIPRQTTLYSSADEVINSLLDLQPEKWGLPPFEDWIDGTLPIDPWYIGGPVIKGFGRGSKMLGIPTANLSAEKFSDILSEHASGVYFGWARLSTRGIYKMVMSIGWNPYFNNTEKTVEPWLLYNFDEDFYGEELHLAIIGYIRPEANFPSLESLIARIHEDRKIAERALDLPLYAGLKDAPFLKNSYIHNCHI